MKRKLKRRKGIKWDYNDDGQRKTEVIPKFWKRYWRKWLLKQNKDGQEKE
ncbi:MAG: hypothetical protein ACP5N7_00120 [Candidatus Pacearchaeota archaeon]